MDNEAIVFRLKKSFDIPVHKPNKTIKGLFINVFFSSLQK